MNLTKDGTRGRNPITRNLQKKERKKESSSSESGAEISPLIIVADVHLDISPVVIAR